MTAFTVPVVDLASSSPAAFVAALRESSCLFVTGHGVPAGLMAEMTEVSTAFFDLPRERKLPTRWPGDGLWRGWQPVYEGAADLTGGRVPDLLERFEVALSRSPGRQPGRAAPRPSRCGRQRRPASPGSGPGTTRRSAASPAG